MDLSSPTVKQVAPFKEEQEVLQKSDQYTYHIATLPWNG